MDKKIPQKNNEKKMWKFIEKTIFLIILIINYKWNNNDETELLWWKTLNQYNKKKQSKKYIYV